jgi:electron transport complex protein RnfC
MINFLKTFQGGVHINDNKFLTENSPIKRTPVPKKVRIPLSQHAGKPADPVIKIGDYVKTGQQIGQANGFISANIHSSVTGQVLSISKFPHPVSGESFCVEIESAEKEEFVYLSGNEENVLARIKDAGVIGMGGAMFPTHVKLQPPKEKKIDTVILNAAECEPFVTSDYRVMIERPDDVIKGLKLVMKVLNVDNALIGIEANKKEAIGILQSKIKGDKNIKLEVLATKYPQGGEKQIIKVLLNREVPSGGLPFDVGVVAHNVGTIIAVYEAVHLRKPLYERVVTVTGSCIKEPSNWLVRIGTLFSDLVDWSGGLNDHASKLIMGGPMMGIAQYTFDVPVIKGTNAILVMKKDDVSNIKKEPCIRCGKCVLKCPVGLDPGRLAVLIEKGKFEEAKDFGVMDCIECGVCAYLCPANRDLVQLIKYAKKKIMQDKKVTK